MKRSFIPNSSDSNNASLKLSVLVLTECAVARFRALYCSAALTFDKIKKVFSFFYNLHKCARFGWPKVACRTVVALYVCLSVCHS